MSYITKIQLKQVSVCEIGKILQLKYIRVLSLFEHHQLGRCCCTAWTSFTSGGLLLSTLQLRSEGDDLVMTVFISTAVFSPLRTVSHECERLCDLADLPRCDHLQGDQSGRCDRFFGCHSVHFHPFQSYPDEISLGYMLVSGVNGGSVSLPPSCPPSTFFCL